MTGFKLKYKFDTSIIKSKLLNVLSQNVSKVTYEMIEKMQFWNIFKYIDMCITQCYEIEYLDIPDDIPEECVRKHECHICHCPLDQQEHAKIFFHIGYDNDGICICEKHVTMHEFDITMTSQQEDLILHEILDDVSKYICREVEDELYTELREYDYLLPPSVLDTMAEMISQSLVIV